MRWESVCARQRSHWQDYCRNYGWGQRANRSGASTPRKASTKALRKRRGRRFRSDGSGQIDPEQLLQRIGCATRSTKAYLARESTDPQLETPTLRTTGKMSLGLLSSQGWHLTVV